MWKRSSATYAALAERPPHPTPPPPTPCLTSGVHRRPRSALIGLSGSPGSQEDQILHLVQIVVIPPPPASPPRVCVFREFVLLKTDSGAAVCFALCTI